MAADAALEAAEDGGEGEGEERGEAEGEEEPDDEGVALPQPELAGESDGVGAGLMEELSGGERDRRGVEEAGAQAEKGEEQKDLERVDEVVGELRSSEVEAEGEGEEEAEEGGRAEEGIDADNEAEGEAPGETLGAGAQA